MSTRAIRIGGGPLLALALAALFALCLTPILAFADAAVDQVNFGATAQGSEPVVEIDTDGIPPAVVGEEYSAEIGLAISGIPEGTNSIGVEADESFADLAGFGLDEYEIDPLSGEGLLVFSGVANETDYTTCEMYFFFYGESGNTLGEASASIDFVFESGDTGELRFTTSPHGITDSYGVPFTGTIIFDSNKAIPEEAVLSIVFGDMPEGLVAGALTKKTERTATVTISGIAKKAGSYSIPAQITCAIGDEQKTAFDGEVLITVSPLRLEDLTMKVESSDSDIIYCGVPVEPSVNLETRIATGMVDGQVIWETVPVEGGYTVAYSNNDKAGDATAIITSDGANITGDPREIVFEILPGNIADCTIDAIPAQIATGKPIEPELTVKCGENVLQKDVDYTVSYANNVAPGTATATVAGVEGKFEGEQSVDFQIALSEADAKAVENATAAIQSLPSASAIAAGDDAALKKVDEAMAAYLALSDAARAQVGPAALAALVNAGNAASLAKTAKAEKLEKDLAAAKGAESGLKANPMTVKAMDVKAKAKKKTTVKKAKAFEVSGAVGKVSFYKVKGNAKIAVSNSGKVTVKKGLKKGKTFKVKVLVCADGDKSTAPAMKMVTLKVKVAK